MNAVRVCALSASVVLLTAAPVAARDAPAPADIAWTQAPSFVDVAAAYPSTAKAKGLTGEVALSCTFVGMGRLGACRTLSEAPEGAGFAEAARRLSGDFQGPSETPSGAQTRIAFKFVPDELAAKTIARPEWVALPTPAQFQGVFPDAASKAGVLKAKAVMDCTVTATGGLADCKLVSEDPAGYGLGQAILPLARAFRLKIWTADGQPVVGGVVRAPIRYDMKQSPQPADPKP